MVAVVSAIAASTVVFLVVSRWRLAGTLTGAALIPVVYTLVSHWSSQSLDHMAKWLRRHTVRGRSADRPARSSPVASSLRVAPREAVQASHGGAAAGDQIPKRGAAKTQWLLLGVASVALAVSIYSLASPGRVEKVIVHDTVIQRTIAFTAKAQTSGTQVPGVGASATTTPPATGESTATSTVTTASPDPTGQPGGVSSTTVDPGQAGQPGITSSTMAVSPTSATSSP